MTDTKNILIAKRYSDALFDIAKDGNLSFEQISSDLNLISNTVENSSDLKSFLSNPVISSEDKKDVLDKIFTNNIDSTVLNFLKVLIDKNRFNALNEIIKSYNEYLDRQNNISRVEVISAVTMPEEAKNRLIEKLSFKLGKNVLIENSIDESIIAGLIIKIGDNIIDTSLRHKLDELEKSIT